MSGDPRAARVLRAALGLAVGGALAACADSSPASPDDDPIVTFPDPVVEDAVQEEIARLRTTGPLRNHATHSGPIRRSDLEGITSLHAGPGVTNLSGVEQMRDLARLTIRGTRNGPGGASAPLDLTPLAALSGLRNVELADSRNPDLTPLAGLSRIEVFAVKRSEISDLTPLAGLAHLRTLMVERSELSDLTPLAGLAHLRTLIVERSEFSDFTQLRAFGGLTRLFLFDNPGLEDLAPLSALDGLEALSLTGGGISDIRPLRGHDRLNGLAVTRTRVSDLTPLAGLKGLGAPGAVLNLRENEIADISPLLDIPVTSDRPITLLLEGNPLSAKALCQDLPALRARGWQHGTPEPCPP